MILVEKFLSCKLKYTFSVKGSFIQNNFHIFPPWIPPCHGIKISKNKKRRRKTFLFRKICCSFSWWTLSIKKVNIRRYIDEIWKFKSEYTTGTIFEQNLSRYHFPPGALYTIFGRFMSLENDVTSMRIFAATLFYKIFKVECIRIVM